MLLTGGGEAPAALFAAVAPAGAPTVITPAIARTALSLIEDIRRTSLWWSSCLSMLATRAVSVVGREGALLPTSRVG